MKKTFKVVLSLCVALIVAVLPLCSSVLVTQAADGVLEREDWAEYTKDSLNTLMATYGSKKAGGNPYVVFDFDNTCSIFDVEEQLAAYQLQTMAFAITPEQLPAILVTELSELDKDLTELGYGK